MRSAHRGEHIAGRLIRLIVFGFAAKATTGHKLFFSFLYSKVQKKIDRFIVRYTQAVGKVPQSPQRGGFYRHTAGGTFV